MKYRCIEAFIVDSYDTDGFIIENSAKILGEGMVYTLDETGGTIIGGEVHLDHEDGSWLEITKDTLDQYFEKVDVDHNTKQEADDGLQGSD